MKHRHAHENRGFPRDRYFFSKIINSTCKLQIIQLDFVLGVVNYAGLVVADHLAGQSALFGHSTNLEIITPILSEQTFKVISSIGRIKTLLNLLKFFEIITFEVWFLNVSLWQ